MKTKFIEWCAYHYNGVTDFVCRVILTISAITALVTIFNIICPIF